MEYLFITFPIILALWLIYKYPQQLKNLFAFKKKPVEPVPGKALSLADTFAYENISDINEPIRQETVPVVRHEIIKHDYRISYKNEPWPRWTCKCGASDYEPTHVLTNLTQAQQKAREAGAAHVQNAIIADEMLKQTNGKFAF